MHQRKLIGMFLFFITCGFMISCGSANVARIGIVLSPICAEVAVGATQQFNATIFVDGVKQAPDPDNTAVTWSVDGGNVNGTIDAAGLYQAPNAVPPPADEVMVVATSKEDTQKEGQALVVLSGNCP